MTVISDVYLIDFLRIIFELFLDNFAVFVKAINHNKQGLDNEKTLPTKGSKSNTHTVVLLVNSHKTFGIVEGFRVGGTFFLWGLPATNDW